MATASPAPLLIPKTSGPANGLRKAVCKSKPLVARAAPASRAVMACGRRDSRMIYRLADSKGPSVPINACDTSVPEDVRMPNTSLNGILMLPHAKLAKKRNAIATRSAKEYIVALFIIAELLESRLIKNRT